MSPHVLATILACFAALTTPATSLHAAMPMSIKTFSSFAEDTADSTSDYAALVARAPTKMKTCTDALTPNVFANKVQLTHNDFINGTYIINTSGVYVLQEDISFAPHTPKMHPPANSTKYALEKGYWLGFFAAIAIAADNVIIDLNGHKIEMSPEFSLRQRFFSIIELADKPFLASTGPPQFSNLNTTMVPANCVIITNGVLGLTSHMSIHGNENQHIWIDNVDAVDFETGGIQLNGASNVHINNAIIGPSLGARGSSANTPALATLSQALLLMRIVEVMGTHSAETEFTILDNEIENFITWTLAGNPVDPNSIFTDTSKGYVGVPDGSALYGILLHRSGPAIHDFAACTDSQLEDHEGDPLEIFNLTDIRVKNLKLKTDEIVHLEVDGTAVTGPAGDLVQVEHLRMNDDSYLGNALSEAQRKLAILKSNTTITDSQELFEVFGSTNIPSDFLKWMNHSITFSDAVKDSGATYVCDKDSMGHFNKGVIGIRVEFVKEVLLHNVVIRGLRNLGERTSMAVRCDAKNQYKGSDARGITMAYVNDVQTTGRVKVELVKSDEGSAVGISTRKDIIQSSLNRLKFRNITGVNYERSMDVVLRNVDIISLDFKKKR